MNIVLMIDSTITMGVSMILNSILANEQLEFVKENLSTFPTDTVINFGQFCESIEEYYQLNSFNKYYKLTKNGKIAESIIDDLTDKGLW